MRKQTESVFIEERRSTEHTLMLRIFSMSSSGGVPMTSVISCSWWMSIEVDRPRSNSGTKREQPAKY